VSLGVLEVDNRTDSGGLVFFYVGMVLVYFLTALRIYDIPL
jgi:hypothetical protein